MSYTPHTVWVGGLPRLLYPPPAPLHKEPPEPRPRREKALLAFLRSNPQSNATSIGKFLGADIDSMYKLLNRLHRADLVGYITVPNRSRGTTGGCRYIKLWSIKDGVQEE